MTAVRGDNGIATLTEQVYASIRADILGGRTRPGERLRLAALAERHGVSLSVVREALTRLSGPGVRLVSATPQLGFSVTPLSVDELVDLTGVRCDIEALAMRQAILRGDLAWEAHLLATHHILANTPFCAPALPLRVNEVWAAAHAQFHAALVDGCGSPLLRQVRSSLYDASERYRRWSVPADGGHRDVSSEHRELLQATLARDAERAARLLAEHIQRTADILLQAGLETELPEILAAAT